MRCEGPVNGPCNRCRASQQECIFEKPSKDPHLYNIGEAGVARLDAIENQIKGMQSVLTQLAFHLQSSTSQQVILSSQNGQPDSQEPLFSPFSLPRGVWNTARAMNLSSNGRRYVDEPGTEHDQDIRSQGRRARNDISIDSLTSQTASNAHRFGPQHQQSPLPLKVRPSGPPAPPVPPLSAKRSCDGNTLDNGEDSTDREADFTNAELYAPIEALRGLADAATAHASDGDKQDEAMLLASRSMDGRNTQNSHPLRQSSPSKRSKRLRSGEEAAQLGRCRSKRSSFTDGGRQPQSRLGARRSFLASDIVASGYVGMDEARHLWKTFMQGCPKFIGVFSPRAEYNSCSDIPQSLNMSTHVHRSGNTERTTDAEEDEKLAGFETTRRTSPFLFASILAVGAKVGLALGTHSRLAQRCMECAQVHAQETLFCPSSVLTKEDVMAINLLASYCDNGWVLCGHGVRIAQEQRLDGDFSRLQQLAAQDSSLVAGEVHEKGPEKMDSKLCELARGARIWFFSFLLEHQISYGAGRPAMVHRSLVAHCRDFLKLREPLTSPIDARFVSTLELMVLRERHHACLAPFDGPIDESMYRRVIELNGDLHSWIEYWTCEFRKRGYDDDSFFLGSLRLQCATAKLYLTCTILRQINDTHESWNDISHWHRVIVTQAVKAADQTLRIAVNNREYFNLLTWAPHYTIVTATFSAVFLLKALRLYPSSQLISTRSLQEIFEHAEKLAERFKEIPAASKYGFIILRMLWHAFKFIVGVNKKKGLSVIFGNGNPLSTSNGVAGNFASDAYAEKNDDETGAGMPGTAKIPGSNGTSGLGMHHSSHDDTRSNKSGADDDDGNEGDVRSFDAVIAAIDWDNMDQGDYRQLLCELDLRNQPPTHPGRSDHPPLPQQTQPLPLLAGSAPSLDAQAASAMSCGRSSAPQWPAADALSIVAPTVVSTTRPFDSILEASSRLPVRLPAWVQPDTLADSAPREWPSGTSFSPTSQSTVSTGALPRHSSTLTDPGSGCNRPASSKTLSATTEGRLGDIHVATDIQVSSNTTRTGNLLSAPRSHLVQGMPNEVQFNTFDQIAHELDLSDTFAELFGPATSGGPTTLGSSSSANCVGPGTTDAMTLPPNPAHAGTLTPGLPPLQHQQGRHGTHQQSSTTMVSASPSLQHEGRGT